MKVFKPSKIILRKWADGQKLSIWHCEPGIWSYCHEYDGTENRVGGMFPSKTAILLDAPEYLKTWGNSDANS